MTARYERGKSEVFRIDLSCFGSGEEASAVVTLQDKADLNLKSEVKFKALHKPRQQVNNKSTYLQNKGIK